MTKSWNHLHENICDEENLKLAFRNACKGKSGKSYVMEFRKNRDKELCLLKEELENQSYMPRPLHRFVISDPKTRVIHAPAFRDRVIHHAICNILEPLFDETFIFDSYASRKGKGMHRALRRFDVFKRRVTQNGVMVPHAPSPYTNMISGWVLKADIRHYFPSIDHEILKNLLRQKIRDKHVMNLLENIIETYATSPGKGMPLGALTSQLFANVYLNPLDHFVKEQMRQKHYIRYLDDFIILAKTRKDLEKIKDEIEIFVSNELDIQLHPEKSDIFPLHSGVKFLGFRIFYHHRLLKEANVRQARMRFARLADEYTTGCLQKEEIERRMQGWAAHASWADTYKLRQEILGSLGEPT